MSTTRTPKRRPEDLQLRVWYVFCALLVGAAVLVAASARRTWAGCQAGAGSEACLALRNAVGLLPLQARTDAARVPGAALLGALALTVTLAAWLYLLARLRLGRNGRLAGLIVAAPLILLALGAWLGVASPAIWTDRSLLWIIAGVVAEFVGVFFLVYVSMADRTPIDPASVRRLTVAVLAITAFGAMHQSVEFMAVSVLDTSAGGAPRYLGLGTALWLLLCAITIVVLLQFELRQPADKSHRL